MGHEKVVSSLQSQTIVEDAGELKAQERDGSVAKVNLNLKEKVIEEYAQRITKSVYQKGEVKLYAQREIIPIDGVSEEGYSEGLSRGQVIKHVASGETPQKMAQKSEIIATDSVIENCITITQPVTEGEESEGVEEQELMQGSSAITISKRKPN